MPGKIEWICFWKEFQSWITGFADGDGATTRTHTPKLRIQLSLHQVRNNNVLPVTDASNPAEKSAPSSRGAVRNSQIGEDSTPNSRFSVEATAPALVDFQPI
jgi:hypothetical protein